MGEIFEYRGISDLVYAKVIKDDNEADGGYVTGQVKSLAGIAELGRSTETSSEPHYYDNMPAIVISSTGSDEVTLTVSAIPLNVLADITGQIYDETTGSFIEGERTPKYFALGYKTKKTNGDEVYVWRFKGQFSIPDSTHSTETNGTDANGQEITFTGIQTTHKFTKAGNKGCKALNVDLGENKAVVTDFFDEVTTPDDLVAKTAYTLTITQAEGTTVTVKKGVQTLTSGATVYGGDVLTISVTGGTLTVNSESFTSGDTHTVSANVTVVSIASA